MLAVSLWDVEEIKDQKFAGKLHYLVKWTWWPSEYKHRISEEAMANGPRITVKDKTHTPTNKQVIDENDWMNASDD